MKNNPSGNQERKPAVKPKAKKRVKNPKPEMLTRTGEISSFSATVRISAVHQRGNEPEIESQPWLELRGKLHEPVKGVTDLKVSLYPREPLTVGTVRPASVGAIIGAKPELHAILIVAVARVNRSTRLRRCSPMASSEASATRPR